MSLIQCTETLNLSKDESTSACTSVIRKTTIEADSSVSLPELVQKEEPQPSTSGCVRKPNVVFNVNPTNRLKPNKQPKKLVVKLKKPLVVAAEGSTLEPPQECPSAAEDLLIKSEVLCDDSVVMTEQKEDEDVKLGGASCKMECEEPYDTTFLD